MIQTDICSPFTLEVWEAIGISLPLIDDFSRYGYVELIRDKSYSLEVFKAFMTKVELQKGKKIKVVNFDAHGEYYSRYDEIGSNLGPFAKFLLEYGIEPSYTMLGTPEQNSILERRNRTLFERG